MRNSFQKQQICRTASFSGNYPAFQKNLHPCCISYPFGSRPCCGICGFDLPPLNRICHFAENRFGLCCHHPFRHGYHVDLCCHDHLGHDVLHQYPHRSHQCEYTYRHFCLLPSCRQRQRQREWSGQDTALWEQDCTHPARYRRCRLCQTYQLWRCVQCGEHNFLTRWAGHSLLPWPNRPRRFHELPRRWPPSI